MKKHVFLITMLFLGLVFSCKKDKDDSLPLTHEERVELALKNLKTEKERNFFDKSYILRENPNILESLRPRDQTDDLINSVFDFLLLKNEEEPYLANWIEAFGYPVWTQGFITPDTTNQAYKIVVMPFAHIGGDRTSAFMMAYPKSWATGSDWHIFIFDRASIEAHALANLPDTLGFGYKIATIAQFDKDLFGLENEMLFEWLGNNLPAQLEGFSAGQVDDRELTLTVSRCIRVGIAFNDGDAEERGTPCDEGQPGWYEYFLTQTYPCWPQYWTNVQSSWTGNNNLGSGNNGGSGGSVFTNDFASDLFSNPNFYYIMSECPFSSGNPPLIYQTSGNTNNWAGQFMNAVNYFLEQSLNGGTPSFTNALATNYGNSSNNIFHHLPHASQNQAVEEALSEVFEEMEMKYKACTNQNQMGGEGGELLNLELCECLGEYSVNDGLNDFFINLYGVGTNGFVELFEVVMELEEELGLTEGEVDWFLSHSEIAFNLYEMMPTIQSSYVSDADDAVVLGSEVFDAIEQAGLLYGSYNEDFLEIIEEQLDVTDGGISFFIAWTYECAFLKLEYPNWSLKQIALFAFIKVTHETVHGTLDAAGMIPGFGEIADLSNAALYTLEGDGLNATLSAASAIPIGG